MCGKIYFITVTSKNHETKTKVFVLLVFFYVENNFGL